MRLLFLLLFFFTFDLSAGIEAHFKSVGHKSGYHGMHKIDFIYLINLDERPEKWQDCCRRLIPHSILPFRVSAVNGWKLSSKVINELGVPHKAHHPQGIFGAYYDQAGKMQSEVIYMLGRNYFSYKMSRGAIGVALSHLSVLQDAFDSGYQTIWIMEDDVEVLQNPHLLSQLIEKLDARVGKNGWDVLYTDRDSKDREGRSLTCWSYASRPNFQPKRPERFGWKKKISRDFRQIWSRYGTYSMIIRRSGMRKILEFAKKYKLFLPYDMDLILAPDLKLYTVLNDIVSTQPQAASDNWTPGYIK